jgi:23S rRNA (cytosine1962-C5)-methyltransferase
MCPDIGAIEVALIRTAGPVVSLRLNRDLNRAIKRGHPWVYGDALDSRPRAALGSVARLSDRRGRPLAMGYYDPDGPLSLRVCHTRPRRPLDDAWAASRLEAACQLRAGWRHSETTTGYRLFNGEGDGLPGLVCDVYGDTAVLKLDGPVAEAFWDDQGVAQWVAQALDVSRVYGRRRSRGGPEGGPLVGDTPQQPVVFLENGLRFTADVVQGQKTGFFLDQRDNRARVRAWSRDRRVLNLFGYTGGFSIAALAGGADEVTTVDVAPAAVAAATAHVMANGFEASRHHAVTEDAFAFLDDAVARGRMWDLVVVDPPSFAPNKKALDKAAGAYRRLISTAAQVTEPGGLLAAASCSSHISPEGFLGLCEEGIGGARRRATVLARHDQPIDHPTPLAFPAFRYLKFVLMRVD